MAELQAQVTAAVSHVTRCICSGTNLTLNSSSNRLECVFQISHAAHRLRFCCGVMATVGMGSLPRSSSTWPNSRCQVKNAYEAQLIAFIICKSKQINGCRVTELSVRAKSCGQMGSRVLLTLAHIATQLECCANCSCAATSDTHGSCKCMVRGVTQIVGIWRRLAISLRSSSVVRSGSGWSLGRTRTRILPFGRKSPFAARQKEYPVFVKKKWSQTTFGCWLGSIATTPNLLAKVEEGFWSSTGFQHILQARTNRWLPCQQPLCPWCCRFRSWYNVGNSKHCGHCGRSWASRGNARDTGKWTCQQCHTMLCGAQRQDRTTYKNGTREWPTTPNNTKDTNNELWNLIEAETKQDQSDSSKPNRTPPW